MPSFETGVRLLKNILIKKRNYSAFFADETDALHKAFPAKATVHAGPFGIPMLWNSARNFLEKKSFEPRQTEGIAYVHIPFCGSRCLFCMFYQNPYSSEAADAYANTLIKEFELWNQRAAQNSAPIKALHFGGGTPTALEPHNIKKILEAARKNLPLTDDCEITFEGRLHGLTDEKLSACVEGGVNRLSIGVQTFNADIRKEMQRLDSPEYIIRRLEEISAIDNLAVVIDLLFGFPGQKGKVWTDDLKIVSELPIDGVDCYQLNVFEKSPLNTRIKSGLCDPAATLAEAADMYAESVEHFSANPNWHRLTNTHWARTPLERNL